MGVSSDYLHEALNPYDLEQTIRRSIRLIQNSGLVFDAIAFRGMSGALVAPSVAMRMSKGMLMVRKESDSTHSCTRVEGTSNTARYIIVDDFLSTGATCRDICADMANKRPGAVCVGIVLYTTQGDKDVEVDNIPQYR